MIDDRIRLGKLFLEDSANILCSIGEDMEGELRLVFNNQNFGKVIPYTWKSRAKPTNTGEAKLRPQIVAEFVYMGLKDTNQLFLPITSGIERKYNKTDEFGKYRTTTILTSNLGRYKRETLRFSIAGYTPPSDKRWKSGQDEIQALYDSHRLGFNEDGEPFRKHYEGDEVEQHVPFWTYIPEDISGTAESGKAELSNYIPEHGFDTVKPKQLIQYFLNAITSSDDIIMDYFAGSGTTADAVIEQNAEDNNNRKYILVDHEYYFETLIKPRIRKRIYSSAWRDGKPINRIGLSHCLKYMVIESYEDALCNLSLKPAHDMRNLFGDDYILQYMLDIETRESLLNVKAFTTPFEYEMRITEKNETKLRKVDVCETFNYLIGLTVVHQGAIQRYQTVEARNPEYEGAVDLVVDREGQYQFRQIEGTLRNGDKVLIIWRNITDNLLASNAALDAYFLKYRLNPRYLDYDIIYVNGDSNLENLRRDEDHWKVERTETEFNRRMFEEN
jgi:adenine-specific DNA-methyltransferase